MSFSPPVLRHQVSIVGDVGETSSKCGYCGRNDESSVTYGMYAECLTVETYQDLLDRYVIDHYKFLISYVFVIWISDKGFLRFSAVVGDGLEGGYINQSMKRPAVSC